LLIKVVDFNWAKVKFRAGEGVMLVTLEEEYSWFELLCRFPFTVSPAGLAKLRRYSSMLDDCCVLLR